MITKRNNYFFRRWIFFTLILLGSSGLRANDSSAQTAVDLASELLKHINETSGASNSISDKNKEVRSLNNKRSALRQEYYILLNQRDYQQDQYLNFCKDSSSFKDQSAKGMCDEKLKQSESTKQRIADIEKRDDFNLIKSGQEEEENRLTYDSQLGLAEGLYGIDAFADKCKTFGNGGFLAKLQTANKNTPPNPIYDLSKICNDEASCSKFAEQCQAIVSPDGFKEEQGQDFYPLQGSLQFTAGASQQGGGQQQGMGGGAGCKKTNSFTADFEACKDTVTAYNTLVVGETTLATVNQLEMSQLDTRLQKKVKESKDVQKAAIDAQIMRLEKERSLLKREVTLYSAQFSLIASKVSFWPTKKNIAGRGCGCDRQNRKKGLCTKDSGKEVVSACKVLASEYGPQLAENESLRMYFVNLGLQATAKIMEKGMQIKKINENLAALGVTKDEIDENSESNELLVEYCQSAQGQQDTEKCGIYGVNPNYTGSGFDGFGSDPEWGSVNTANVAGNSNALADFGSGTKNKQDQSGLRDGLLDFDNATSENGFADNPNAATFKRGTGGAGGGSAGGGGAGGGGGAPSLSDKGSDASDEEQKSLMKAEVAGGYGSSKGGIYRKGSARKYKSGRDPASENIKDPFADLFPNANKQESPVAPANIALFKVISERYGQAVQDDRIKK